MFSYRIYGLALESELECPELGPGGESGGNPDIIVGKASLPSLPSSATPFKEFDLEPNRLLFGIPNVGRILVRNGREILVDCDAGVTDEQIRLYIFGSALGALLLQRRLLPLHGSAVRLDGGAAVFAGPSRFGKSTLAAALHRRGKALLTDDICVVDMDGSGMPTVPPGFPQQKLCSDSLAVFGETTSDLRRIDITEDKFAVPIQRDFADRAEPLHTVYILSVDDAVSPNIEPLSGTDKVTALLQNTYRKLYLSGMGLRAHNFDLAMRVAAVIRVCRLRRPRHPFLLDELVALVEQDHRRTRAQAGRP